MSTKISVYSTKQKEEFSMLFDHSVVWDKYNQSRNGIYFQNMNEIFEIGDSLNC